MLKDMVWNLNALIEKIYLDVICHKSNANFLIVMDKLKYI